METISLPLPLVKGRGIGYNEARPDDPGRRKRQETESK